MSYIYLSDLRAGLGQAATAATVPTNVPIPGGIASILTVFPSESTALAGQGYGMLYIASNGNLVLSGPYGALTVVDPNTIYSTEQIALAKGYGYIYTQGGNFYLSGPAGAIQINSPPTANTASQLAAATGAVNPTAKAVLSAIASG